MSSIKLKNKLGKEQTYSNVSIIKLPTVEGGLQKFTEGEPVQILNEFTDPIFIHKVLDGTTLEITAPGTISIEKLIRESNHLPLKVDINITKPVVAGTLQLTDLSKVSVAEYEKVEVVAPNLVPENIKKGVTILGVTGTFEPSEIQFDSSHSNYASSIQAKLDSSGSAAYLLSGAEACTNCDFLQFLDFSVVTTSQNAFYNCKNITYIPYLNTCNVTNMNSMFEGCTNLTTIEGLNTQSVLQVNNLFKQCSSLESIPKLELPNVTSISSMFYGCAIKEIPDINLSKITYSPSLFAYCSNLTKVPYLNLAASRDISSLFLNCTQLKYANLNTDSAGFLDGTFSDCSMLEKVELSYWRKWLRDYEESSLTEYFASQNCFKNCYSLKEIIFKEIGLQDNMGYATKSPDLSSCCHFTGTVHEVYNPAGVKDGILRVPAYWLPMLKEYSWQSYADVLTALEDIQTLDNVTAYNKPQMKEMTINLYRFESAPIATITSSDPRIVTVTNIISRKNKITFRLNFTGKLGKASITVDVQGDYSTNYSFDAAFENYYGPTYRVEDVEGAKYNFTLNSEDYYESTNNNRNSTDSFGLCRLVINNNKTTPVQLELDCINHNRNNWGVISLLDTPLSISNTDEDSLLYKSFRQVYFSTTDKGDPIALSMPSPQRVTYEIPTGEHSIYIKFVNIYGGNETESYRPNNFRFKVVNFIPESLKL